MSHCITNWATALPTEPLHYQLSHCITNWATALPTEPLHYQLSHCITNWATALPTEPLHYQLSHCTPLKTLYSLRKQHRFREAMKPADQGPHGFHLHNESKLTLKAPRKKASEKWCLLKSSAAKNSLTLLTNLSIEANRVDPDQTAPLGAVWSGSLLFVIAAS